MFLGSEKVKMSLPLLSLPLMIGTTPTPVERNINRLLILFCAGVVAAAIACILIYIADGIPPGGDYRDISVILPHIRFAILINMAIVILLYFGFNPEGNRPDETVIFRGFKTRILYLIPAAFLAGFLFFLRSATGILTFMVIAIFIVLNLTFRSRNRTLRYAVAGAIAGITLAAAALLTYPWIHNFRAEPVDFKILDKYTVNGNPYVHDTASGILENGYYTGLFLCEPELQREWNKISKLKYDSTDLRGQQISSTLKRYLTSKGLRKDSASVHLLSPIDIGNIEKGFANHKFHAYTGISQRLYETLYEIHVFERTGFVEQHSFGQRLAFLVESVRLIRQNFWTGVGPGDVYRSLHTQSKIDLIAIDPKWEGKPHNQFAYFGLAFGITGLLWIVISWIYPVIRYKTYRNLLFNLFAVIILISMLVMDTLESYDSMVFFAFFYSMLIFGVNEDPGN